MPCLAVNISNTRTVPVLASRTRTPLCLSGYILPVIFLPSVQTLHCPSLLSVLLASCAPQLLPLHLNPPNLGPGTRKTALLGHFKHVLQPYQSVSWSKASADSSLPALLLTPTHAKGQYSCHPQPQDSTSSSPLQPKMGCERTSQTRAPTLPEGWHYLPLFARLILLGLLTFAPKEMIFQPPAVS